MSKNYNDCDIVLELLPLYIEQKTGAESNLFVKKHLSECESCQQAFQFMSQDLSESIQDTEMISKRMKQTKKRRFIRRIKQMLILLTGVIGYIGLMIAIIVWFFMYLSGA